MAIEFDFGLLADLAQVAGGGKLNILGEFQVIQAPAAPARHGPFYAIARWVADTVDVRSEPGVEIEVVDEDGQPISPKSPKLPLRFMPRVHDKKKAQAQLIIQFNPLDLPRFGGYAIQFFINERPAGSISLYLLQAPTAAVPDAQG